MMRKIIKKVTTEERKTLLSNFMSLSILQGLNYLLPLITMPYIIRVVGLENFGLIAFAAAIIAYFNVIVDYGFNLTATRDVAVHRDDKAKITEIYSSVMTIKLMLVFACLICLVIIAALFNEFFSNMAIYFFTFGIVIGQALFPVWFFQGMEKMKYITYLHILSKSIFTLMIFIFVQEESDFYIVPLLTSFGFIVAGVLSQILIKKEFNIVFEWQQIKKIKYYLKNGWHVFISRLYVNLYTTTNIVLLGFLTNNLTVGYFSIAEKIVLAIAGIFEPANQALYPYLVKKYNESIEQFGKLLKKIVLVFFSIAILLFLVTEYFKYDIITLVNGDYSAEVDILLSVFLIRILTYPFGSLFSNTLILMHEKKYFMQGMNYTVLLNFLIVPFSIYFYGAFGMVISLIMIYIFIILFYGKKISNILRKG